jgi:hypothetical protein
VNREAKTLTWSKGRNKGAKRRQDGIGVLDGDEVAGYGFCCQPCASVVSVLRVVRISYQALEPHGKLS